MVVPASGPRATGLGRLCCWSEPQATGLGVRLRPSVLFSGLNHEPQGSGFVCDLCLVLTKVVRWQLWPSYARNYLSHWHWPFMALALARIARFRIVHGHTPINRPARKERISACTPSRRLLGVNPFVNAASRRTVSALRSNFAWHIRHLRVGPALPRRTLLALEAAAASSAPYASRAPRCRCLFFNMLLPS